VESAGIYWIPTTPPGSRWNVWGRVKYCYDQKRTRAPEYNPGDRVYLNASDIQTIRLSKKLSHRHLGPFTVERKVGNGAYRLQLPQSMKRLHPVFNVVKLTPAPPDPIVGQRAPPPPPPEIIDGEEEWVVEEILDSKMMNRKLRYLVKWENFGAEHNSWEPWDNLHAPELVEKFHQRHPGAARRIRSVEFNLIKFRPIPATTAPGRRFSEGAVDVRGHPIPSSPTPSTQKYIPPHRH
jgi:Chromo (CHRromatin Organisation MOdifier) domain